MADFDDLENALSTEAAVIPQELLVRYPEQFPRDHLFIDAAGNQLSAGDFADANTKGESLNIDGFLTDLNGVTYFPQEDAGGNLFLRVVLDDALDQAIDAGPAFTPAEYRLYLKVTISALEKIVYYLTLSSRLHKESVQDAVDIVQSKRLDFLETKQEEVDVVGIFSAAIITVLFQAGLPGAIVGQVFRAAAKLSSRAFIRKALDVVFVFAGKRSGKSSLQAQIKELDAEIARLQRECDAAKARGLELRSRARTNEAARDAVKNLFQRARGKSAARASAEQQKALLEARLPDELIAIGKTEVDSLKATLKTKVIDPNKGTIEGKAQEKATALLKDVLDGNTPEAAPPPIVPVDVYLKSYVQNFYEEHLGVYERLLMLTRDLLDDFEVRQMSTAEDAKLHELVLDLLPSRDALESTVAAYRELFGAEFSYKAAKDTQTREYEFIIWSLLLRSKVRVFVDVLLIRGKAEAAAASNFNDEVKKMLAKPTIYEIVEVSDPLAKYLSKRFGIAEDKQALGAAIKAAVEQMDTSIASINARLTSQNAGGYQVAILPRQSSS